MREIFAQALESQKRRPSDTPKIYLLMYFYRTISHTLNMSDKSTLSDV
ncbi:hypothetical protein C8J37_1454, partial [Rhizobium sp. PP-WC-1G-195]